MILCASFWMSFPLIFLIHYKDRPQKPDFVKQPDVAAASEVGAGVGAGSGAVSAGHIGALPFGHLVEDLVG